MWTTFAATISGASAGLTGLMFIVVSFRFDTIARSEEYRNRAAQTLSLFLTTTVIGTLITVPQPLWSLGIEMVVIVALSAALLFSLDVAARRSQSRRPSITLMTGLALFVSTIAICGVLLITGLEAGLYFFVAGAVIALVLGANGAWTFLTRAGMDHESDPAAAA